MMDFYNNTHPKARKVHKCEYCNKEIAKDEKYSSESGKFNGDFFTRKLCFVCSKIFSEFCSESSEDEFDWWEVDDWLRERYCHNCEHSQSENDDCEYEFAQCPKIRKDFESEERD